MKYIIFITGYIIAISAFIKYEIYSLFYKNRETQSEIGKKIGVTRQSISKVLKKINGKFDYASQNITNHYHEQVM